MTHHQCNNLFQAGKTLLEKSQLVLYTGQSFKGNSNYDKVKKHWCKNFDPQFGRYMAWVWFSVGAENLAKAALTCNGVITGKLTNLGYPIYNDTLTKSEWMAKVLKPQKGAYGSAEAQNYYFKTLDRICKFELDKLSDMRGICPDERKELKVAYKYLTEAIRNRDAHTYIENVREKDFLAVAKIFKPAFNTLVQTMMDNGHPF